MFSRSVSLRSRAGSNLEQRPGAPGTPVSTFLFSRLRPCHSGGAQDPGELTRATGSGGENGTAELLCLHSTISGRAHHKAASRRWGLLGISRLRGTRTRTNRVVQPCLENHNEKADIGCSTRNLGDLQPFFWGREFYTPSSGRASARAQRGAQAQVLLCLCRGRGGIAVVAVKQAVR